MPADVSPFFSYEDDPANPGWKLWQATDPTRFNSQLGPLSVRLDGEIARVRMTPERRHSNLRDHVHGGALLGFIDVAMFAACRGFGVLTAGAAVTLDLSTQFIGGGSVDHPIEAQVELLRDLCDTMVSGSLCAMGGMTPYPVISALEHFPEDFGLDTASQRPAAAAA